MAPPTTAADKAAVTARDTVAVIAPTPDADYAHALTARGYNALAVTLNDRLRRRAGLRGYVTTLSHSRLHRTAATLRAIGVSAITAGSAHGVALAEQLAAHLALQGNRPESTELRTDRGAQANALQSAGISAPHQIRTDSLDEAVRWWQVSRIGPCILLPAAVSVPAEPALCSSSRQISEAWRGLRRTAHTHSGDAGLVLREALPGRHFLVYSVTRPATQPGLLADHVVTDVWAQTHTDGGVLSYTSLMRRSSLLARALSLYVQLLLEALAVTSGPVCSRVCYTAERGLLLKSVTAVAQCSGADGALRRSTGRDRLGDALDMLLPSARGQLIPAPTGDRVVRVPLYARHTGVLDVDRLNKMASLPTVVHVDKQLCAPAEHISHTGTRAGEIVLSHPNPGLIERDYRTVRALERHLYRTAPFSAEPAVTS